VNQLRACSLRHSSVSGLKCVSRGLSLDFGKFFEFFGFCASDWLHNYHLFLSDRLFSAPFSMPMSDHPATSDQSLSSGNPSRATDAAAPTAFVSLFLAERRTEMKRILKRIRISQFSIPVASSRCKLNPEPPVLSFPGSRRAPCVRTEL
jgi:hypothetical protein